MYTTQSKMISRAIWVEKKHVWKINLQKNGVRKSFYSSVPGDKGRKICAQNATSWLSGACPFSVSERTTVDTVFERYLQDKALETTNIYTIRNRYNNHIKPIIGKVPVMLLTKQDLKELSIPHTESTILVKKVLKIYAAIYLDSVIIWTVPISGTICVHQTLKFPQTPKKVKSKHLTFLRLTSYSPNLRCLIMVRFVKTA